MAYIIAPFVGWVIAGGLKFLVNCVVARRAAFDRIGMGRLPSTHASIVCSTAMIVGLRDGFMAPVFGVALTVALIVIIDGLDLRRKVESHAIAVNRLREEVGGNTEAPLRERIGHRPHEILAGIVTGAACATAVHFLVP